MAREVSIGAVRRFRATAPDIRRRLAQDVGVAVAGVAV